MYFTMLYLLLYYTEKTLFSPFVKFNEYGTEFRLFLTVNYQLSIYNYYNDILFLS